MRSVGLTRPSVAMLALTLGLAGLGSAPAGAGTQAAAAKSGFPVTVAAEQGKVTIAAKPKRIVSLSASLTEMLYAAGAGPQVVAVDRFSNYPPGTPATELSGLRPNIEAIAKYQPDLVVLANDRDGIVRSLQAVGIPALVLSSADQISDVYRQLNVLGVATGNPKVAKTAVTDIRSRITEIADVATRRARPIRYYYELSSALHSATSKTFIGELLGLLGLESIADEASSASGGFPQLSNEFVVDADPDVIFLAHTDGTPQTLAVVAARPGWSGLRAVRRNQVVSLDPDIAARWGPRIVELLALVAKATAAMRS
jgi:iron complex transport system substrate-binding protein